MFLLNELKGKGVNLLNELGFSRKDVKVSKSMCGRYLGQYHECRFDISPEEITKESLSNIEDAFHNRHKELYTFDDRRSPVEIVDTEITVEGLRPEFVMEKLKRADSKDPSGAKIGEGEVIFAGKTTLTSIYDGNRLKAGHVIEGPAIIEEITTTINILQGWKAEADENMGTYCLLNNIFWVNII